MVVIMPTGKPDPHSKIREIRIPQEIVAMSHAEPGLHGASPQDSNTKPIHDEFK